MEPNNLHLFGDDDWSARDDVRLLDAIEQYGFGNWVDIAKHIEHRSPDQAQERYVQCFINGSLGQLTVPAVSEQQRRDSVAVDHTALDGPAPLSPCLTAPQQAPLLLEPLQVNQLIYMPLRDDFEREFDNGSERLVSQLNVGSVEDEDIDVALKLAHVDMYVLRLRERARRKRVVRDFQLASVFFEEMRKETLLRVPGGARMPRRKKDRTPLSEKLRVLSQFVTRTEFDRFHANLRQQRDLLLRVRELMRYRRCGITRLDDCAVYERAKSARQAGTPPKKIAVKRRAKKVSRSKCRKSRYWRFILAQRAMLDQQTSGEGANDLSIGVTRR